MRYLDQLVNNVLGTPHEEMDCWQFVRYLFREGKGLGLHPAIEHNQRYVDEVWWRDDPFPLLEIVRPWDILIMNTGGALADHVGVVCDVEHFAHSRPRTGVCRERLAKWHKRCLQVARPRL